MASPLFVHDYTSASAEARTSPRVFNVAYQSVNRHKWPAIEVRRRYGASCTHSNYAALSAKLGGKKVKKSLMALIARGVVAVEGKRRGQR